MDHPPSSASGPSETGDRAQIDVLAAYVLGGWSRTVVSDSELIAVVREGMRLSPIAEVTVRRHSDQPAESSSLLTYMTTDSGPKRDAAFLETYAARVRDGSAATWEIPNTVASTLEDIASRLERQDDVADLLTAQAAKLEAAERLIAKWREREQMLCRRADAQATTQYAMRLGAEAEGIANCADQLEAALSSASARPAATQEDKPNKKRIRPEFWRCRSCGCLWRDNSAFGDDSISLGGPTQKSCEKCEHGDITEEGEALYRIPNFNEAVAKLEAAERELDSQKETAEREVSSEFLRARRHFGAHPTGGDAPAPAPRREPDPNEQDGHAV